MCCGSGDRPRTRGTRRDGVGSYSTVQRHLRVGADSDGTEWTAMLQYHTKSYTPSNWCLIVLYWKPLLYCILSSNIVTVFTRSKAIGNFEMMSQITFSVVLLLLGNNWTSGAQNELEGMLAP